MLSEDIANLVIQRYREMIDSIAAVNDGWVETRSVDEETRSKKLLIRSAKSKLSRPLVALMPTL